MALALAYDDAKHNQRRIEGDVSRGKTGATIVTKFFGSRDASHLPHAQLVQFDPGRFSRAHFHMRDQFQVVVDGNCRLGRHDLTPYSVHFSRAYTPYGPLVSGNGTGFTHFVMRAHPDTGAKDIADYKDELKQVPDRQPWQITRQAVFPERSSGMANAGIVLQAIPDIENEQGLAAYTLSAPPNGKARAPDPSRSDGQYLVVLKGSLVHDNKEHKAWALVFVYPEEGSFLIQAGTAGLEALVLNFPRSQIKPGSSSQP